MKRLLITAALLGNAPSLFAEITSGNLLLRNCNSAVKQDDGGDLNEREALEAVHCLGYLSGFTDSHAMEAIAKPQKPLYCLPENGLENAQLARIVVKHLRKNPEELHGNGRVLVAVALTSAFPCKNGQRLTKG